jgi:hypothetical protein
MPYTISYTADGAEIQFTRAVTAAELQAAKRRALGGVYARGLRWQLLDFSGADALTLSPDDLQALADEDDRFTRKHPKFALAIVAPTPLSFGLSRMYETYVQEAVSESQIVKSRDEALAWVQKLMQQT